MRIAAFSALVLSTVMVNAQAPSPALPQAGTNAPVLQSSLSAAKGPLLSTASSSDRPTAPAGAVRVSTGVVPPKLIHVVDVQEDTIPVAGLTGGDRESVVSMMVDEMGKPSDLKIVQSAGPSLDRSILDAVAQYRYRPGSVSGQVISFPVMLHVTIRQSFE